MTRRNYTVKYKRNKKTSYKKRLKLLSSRKTRLSIRRSNSNMSIQFINFDLKGDRIVIGANSYDLKKLGYEKNRGNTPVAYLTGLLAGIRAKKKNIKEAILDLGIQKKGENLFAALKGVLDAGIKIPHSEDIIPNEKRLKGEHIKAFSYSKFEEVKNKILKE